MADIVCLGEPLLEFSQQAGSGPPRFLQGYGGDTSNCAVAAARQGASTGMVTALGDDAFGRAFLELWRAEGVDTRAVQIDPQAHTGIYFISYRDGQHEFSYMRKGSAASRMRPADLPGECIRGARILHVSGISQAISDIAADCVFQAIELARGAGLQVSYDTNLRLKLWPLARARAVIHAAMARAQIALPGLDDARQLTGLDDADAIADFYLKLGAAIVALKMGREGVLLATADGRERLPPHPVEQVDATGAGDVFDGAFLAELVRGAEPRAAAVYASVAAALSTRGHGAVAPIPRRAEVETAMRGSGSP